MNKLLLSLPLLLAATACTTVKGEDALVAAYERGYEEAMNDIDAAIDAKLEGLSSYDDTALAARVAALEAASGFDATELDARISAIEDDYIVAADETALDARISAIEADYVVAADETELDSRISAIEADYLVAADEADLRADLADVTPNRVELEVVGAEISREDLGSTFDEEHPGSLDGLVAPATITTDGGDLHIYLAGYASMHTSASASHSIILIPVVNGVAQPPCAYAHLYSDDSTNTSYTLVCDTVVPLGAGTHTVGFNIKMKGQWTSFNMGNNNIVGRAYIEEVTW